MEISEIIPFISPAISVLVVVIGYVFNLRSERLKRTEAYQLEKIEWILTALADNGTAHIFLTKDDPELVKVRRDSQKAMALIPVYGNQEVLDFTEQKKNNQYSSQDINELVELLTEQARKLARTK